MTLDEYVASLNGIPVPTQAQMFAFAVHIATRTHSWYKKLPMTLPGVPFHVFLDPHAGCDRAELDDGTLIAIERTTVGARDFMLPTAAYREAFGYLSYSTARQPDLGKPDDVSVEYLSSSERPAGAEAQSGSLPDEVIFKGCAYLNAFAHPWLYSPQLLLLEDYASRNIEMHWPREFGGKPALDALIGESRGNPIQPALSDEARAELLQRYPYAKDDVFSFEALNIAGPEQRRQLDGLFDATQRVAVLVAKIRAGLWQPDATPRMRSPFRNAFPLIEPEYGVLSHDQRWLAVVRKAGEAGPSLALFDAQSLTLIATSTLPLGGINDITFTSDGNFLFVAHGRQTHPRDWCGSLLVWNLVSGECRNLLEKEQEILCCRYDPASDTLTLICRPYGNDSSIGSLISLRRHDWVSDPEGFDLLMHPISGDQPENLADHISARSAHAHEALLDVAKLQSLAATRGVPYCVTL